MEEDVNADVAPDGHSDWEQILALALRQKSLERFKLFPLHSEAVRGGPMEEDVNADVAPDGHSDRERDVRRRRRP